MSSEVKGPHFVVPPAYLFETFRYLSAKDLHPCSQVSSLWKRIALHENLSLYEEKRKEWRKGNTCIRNGLRIYADYLSNRSRDSFFLPVPQSFSASNFQQTPLPPKMLCPFIDRSELLKHLQTEKDSIQTVTALKCAAAEGNLTLCESLLPLLTPTYIELGLHCAIRNGHLHVVKRLLNAIPKERSSEALSIHVIFTLQKGESIYLRGQIGTGQYDLNSWEKGFPMKKVKGSENTWEIILLPTIRAEQKKSGDGSILFKFKPALHTASGKIRFSKGLTCTIKSGENMTVTPQFER